MTDREKEAQYSIEARSLGLVGVASHNFLVLRDGEGRALAELHGLATDRKTGRGVAIGTDEALHSLRVWHFAHDAGYAKSIGAQVDGSTFIAEGQDRKTMLVAGKQEVLARWNAAVAAKEPLNALDLDYPNYGFRMSGDTVNSNAAYRTLSEIMGVPVHDFPWKLEPGLDNRMVDQKRVEALRTHGYPVLDEASIKRNGQYESTEPRPMPSPGPSPAPMDDARARYDARSPGHPGHADYARIREGLAGSIRDAAALDNASASAYREMAANPQLKQVDYAGIHDGNIVIAHAPHGLGREPMFSASVPLAQAERAPADASMAQAQEALVAAQERSRAETLVRADSGPGVGVSARSA